jgi:hypothetical protein
MSVMNARLKQRTDSKNPGAPYTSPIAGQTCRRTPCGAGCVNVVIADGGQYTAHLVNGQWQFGGSGKTKCQDGTEVVGASTWENYIDPNTLRGTSFTTYKKAGCGDNLVGQTFTHTLVLTKG